MRIEPIAHDEWYSTWDINELIQKLAEANPGEVRVLKSQEDLLGKEGREPFTTLLTEPVVIIPDLLAARDIQLSEDQSFTEESPHILEENLLELLENLWQKAGEKFPESLRAIVHIDGSHFISFELNFTAVEERGLVILGVLNTLNRLQSFGLDQYLPYHNAIKQAITSFLRQFYVPKNPKAENITDAKMSAHIQSNDNDCGPLSVAFVSLGLKDPIQENECRHKQYIPFLGSSDDDNAQTLDLDMPMSPIIELLENAPRIQTYAKHHSATLRAQHNALLGFSESRPADVVTSPASIVLTPPGSDDFEEPKRKRGDEDERAVLPRSDAKKVKSESVYSQAELQLRIGLWRAITNVMKQFQEEKALEREMHP